MDFSQLPKMSSTPTATKADAASSNDDPLPPAAVPTQHVSADPHLAAPARNYPIDYSSVPYDTSFGSMWLSLISGIILLAIGQTFGRFLLAKLSGRDFATGWLQPDGVTPVKYFELQGGTAWSDMGLFTMGAALLLDAIILGILAARRRPSVGLLFITVALTSLAMLINLGVVFYLFGLGVLPLYSLIALAVGGFVVFDHAPMLKRSV